VADSLRDLISSGVEVFKTPEAAGLSIEDVADALIDKKGERYREAMLRRQANESAAGKDADVYLDAAGNFESKGGYEVEERYADPFGIPVSPADPEPAESIVKEKDQRRERGGAVLVRGREGLSGVRDATSTKGINELVADGAIRREWRERPGLAPGAVDPTQPADRQQLFSDPKYVGGRPIDDVALDDGREKTTIAPAGIGMGGSTGLGTQLADMVLRGEISKDALVPGSTTKTIGDLMNEMAMAADPGLAISADKAVSRQTAERDAVRFSPTVRAQNDANAQRRAANETQISSEARRSLGNIQNIQSLGIAAKKFNRGSNMSVFSVVPNADGEITDRDGGINQMAQYLTDVGEDLPEGMAPQTAGTDIGARTTQGAQNLEDVVRMIGPSGETVGYVDSNGSFLGDVALSGGNQQSTKTQAWLEANLPDMGREGGTSFGYPQVNIGDELALLNQRLGSNVPQGGIRSLEDLENTFVRMIDEKLDSGQALFGYDPATGKTPAVADPGISEVLYRLGYTKNETTRLANSLQQLEAARRSPVNQEFKMLYENGMYDPRGQFAANNYGNDVSLTRVGGEKVGIGDAKGDRVSIRGALADLTGQSEVLTGGEFLGPRDPATIYATTPDGQRVLLPEAQQDLIDAQASVEDAKRPFIGAPAGSKPPKQSFIRGDARGQTPTALAKRMGTQRAEQAQGVERRYLEDERRRRTPETTSPERQAIKDQDSVIKAEGAKRKAADREKVAKGIRKPGIGKNVIDPNFSVEDLRRDFEVPLGARFPAQGDQGKSDDWMKKEREAQINANAESAEAKRLQVAAGVDLRSQGIANPQRATSAVTTQAPDPTPLAERRAWPSERPRRFQSPGFDNQVDASDLPRQGRTTRKRGQTPTNAISQEKTKRAATPRRPTTQQPPRDKPSRGVSNRNRMIRDIMGYTAAGAGSVALGAGIGSAYNGNQQRREEEVYQ